MKNSCYLLLVVLLVSAPGCVFSLPGFTTGGVIQSEAVGGMPPPINPVEEKAEEPEADATEPTKPQTVYVKPSEDAKPTVRHDTSYRPSGPPRVTVDQVTPENAREVLEGVAQEISFQEMMLRP